MKILKSMPEDFQAVLSGVKPFEIRYTQHKFAQGEEVKIVEFSGSEYYFPCKSYKNNCSTINRLHQIEDTVEGEDGTYITQQEAISYCGKNRALCCGYDVLNYTGREITIKIKDIFDLTRLGLCYFVAFTFDILKINNVKSPYCIVQEYPTVKAVKV